MDTPFLSVVVPTDGTHPATFDDLLLALAGQGCDDLEVIVVVTGDDPDAASRLQGAVDGYHESFRDRVRILVAPGLDASSAQAGNVGVSSARGRYLAVLGDDSVPFGHWAPSLMAAAEGAPGRVLRVGVATQLIVAMPGYWKRAVGSGVAGADLVDAYDMVHEPRTDELSEIGLLELLSMPGERLCGYVFPASLIADGLHFDEELGPLADWEFLLQAVEQAGVVTVGILGVLQRVWGEEPVLNVAPVIAKLDARPILLGSGSAGRLAELLAASKVEESSIPGPGEDLQAQLDALGAAHADAAARLESVYRSTSWRVTAPLRAVIDRVRPRR